jgi:hypothetical protein
MFWWDHDRTEVHCIQHDIYPLLPHKIIFGVEFDGNYFIAQDAHFDKVHLFTDAQAIRNKHNDKH